MRITLRWAPLLLAAGICAPAQSPIAAGKKQFEAHCAGCHGADGEDVEMADHRKHYGATSAPLVVNDLVISGTEPLAKTWAGRAIEHGCSTAWLTGTFDPLLDHR